MEMHNRQRNAANKCPLTNAKEPFRENHLPEFETHFLNRSGGDGLHRIVDADSRQITSNLDAWRPDEQDGRRRPPRAARRGRPRRPGRRWDRAANEHGGKL